MSHRIWENGEKLNYSLFQLDEINHLQQSQNMHKSDVPIRKRTLSKQIPLKKSSYVPTIVESRQPIVQYSQRKDSDFKIKRVL